MAPDKSPRTENLAILQKVAQVEVLIEQGYKAYKACEIVKIPRPTFYDNRKKAKGVSAATEDANSPTARDGNGGRDSSQDTRTSKTA
jgi:hypothetical protein